MRESENYEFDLDENARDSFQGDSEDHQPSKRQRRRPSRFSSESQEPGLHFQKNFLWPDFHHISL